MTPETVSDFERLINPAQIETLRAVPTGHEPNPHAHKAEAGCRGERN